MITDADCIFCKIVAQTVPTTIIAEDDRVVAFLDTAPATDGHALVIPRSHSADLTDIDPDDLAAVARLAQQLSARMRDRLGADGVNLLQCSGEAAWQTVFHFHLHVIPRYGDDARRDRLVAPWTFTPGEPESIERLAHVLKSSAPASAPAQLGPPDVVGEQ